MGRVQVFGVVFLASSAKDFVTRERERSYTLDKKVCVLVLLQYELIW